ncbi:MAG: hypothetical protein ABIU54_09170 [Candidatus Eisenbacteria bacterium]
MNSRIRLASVAVLLLLSTHSASSAQQADSIAIASPVLQAEPTAIASPVKLADTTSVARTGAVPGRGSVGGQVGVSSFLAEKDYSQGALPRMSFSGHFRYVINKGLRWQVSPYFTWSAYKVDAPLPFTDINFPADRTKDHFLTQIVGASSQLQFTGGKGAWRHHIGAGPAIYRVVVQNRRKVVKDPVTFRLHQGTYLGATAEFGIERFLKGLANTSLEWTAAYQGAFAKRDEQFPSGFNGSVHAFELRFGAHYYYDFKKKPKKPEGIKKP